MIEDKITMTREQFNKLVDFLEKADKHTRLAFQGNDLDCFTTCHLDEVCDFIDEIDNLLKNVKDNHMKEISETTDENINESERKK